MKIHFGVNGKNVCKGLVSPYIGVRLSDDIAKVTCKNCLGFLRRRKISAGLELHEILRRLSECPPPTPEHRHWTVWNQAELPK